MSGALFLRLDDIPGEATDEKHADEIDLLSWNWAMANPTTVQTGKGLTAGKVTMSDLNMVKFMDKASPNLMKYCCSGKAIPTGTLTVQRAAGDDKIQALKIELEHIIVSSYSMSGDSDANALPTEDVTLSFKKVEYIYTPQDIEGAGEAEINAGWDNVENVGF